MYQQWTPITDIFLKILTKDPLAYFQNKYFKNSYFDTNISNYL